MKLRTSFLPLFTSGAHVLLNRVAKLGLLGAFDDPGRLGVDDGAVEQSWEKEKGFFFFLAKDYFTQNASSVRHVAELARKQRHLEQSLTRELVPTATDGMSN